VKNPKCLNLTPAKISTLVIPVILIILTASIQTILLTMCGIIVQSLTKIPGFWLGYPHLSPRHATTTSELVALKRWETGSSKRGNIEIGWMVQAVMDLTVQPCFVMEVRVLARPTLGKRDDT